MRTKDTEQASPEVLEKLKEKDEKGRRSLAGLQRQFAFVVAVSLTLFTFYTAIFGQLLPMIQRGIHVYAVIILVFLWYPATNRSSRSNASMLDLICVVFCLFACLWLILSNERYTYRIPFSSPIHLVDKIVAVGLVLLCLEIGRRTLGLSITIIASIFILYAFLGPYFPGMLQYKGLTFNKFIDQIYMTTEGIMGSLTGMSATTLFSFISFGVFLQKTGADQYFMDICLALTGKAPGGPAKVSCLSSAMMGTLSGSSIANVVTTGTLTIPIMKASGYSPEEAGGIETAASSGGQIMPPIMGAGAFILAETVGIPYMKVVTVSILPAIIYYISIWFFIDTKARKKKIKGLDSVPDLRKACILGIPYFIPICILFGLLVLNYTPFLSAVCCTIMILVVAQCKKSTRLNLKQFGLMLESCAIGMTSITGVILCASIVVGMINITGLMMKSTQLILSISRGSLPLTILLCAVVSYVMGMGLPVPTCYVILSTLAAPAIAQMGAGLLNAHLMIFWFTQLAQITPPVCMSAFAAAAIAKADSMKTGWSALKISSGFYFIPIMFIYSKLLDGTVAERIAIALMMTIGIYFMVAALEGFFISNASLAVRMICSIIFVAMFVCCSGEIAMLSRVIIAGSCAFIAALMAMFQRKKSRVPASG